jgi:hypothetical protein
MQRYRRLLLLTIVAIVLGPLPIRSVRAQSEVAEPFRAYYDAHQGLRILGNPLTELVELDGIPAQYFEKGRIEDHRQQVNDPAWATMFGRLTAELIERDPLGAVSGTTINYGILAYAHREEARVAAPFNFVRAGTMTTRRGEFVPYDAQLRPAPGYIVPLYFWSYMNRRDLFPGGWLHDIGLPMTDAFQAQAIKNGVTRDIIMQAFERTVLTFDVRNPPAWQVERANIGADALRTVQLPPQSPIDIPAPGATVTLPLHILARVGQPGKQVVARIRWQDGTELTRILPVLRGADGQGLVIGNLAWTTESQPPQPAERSAMFDLRNSVGQILAQRSIQVLRWDDPDTQPIELAWVLGDQIALETRRVPKTAHIGTAALEELLWGPRPGSLAGFTTAIPTPEEVLAYAGRAADWEARVKLRSLAIENGVATADFSPELRAYGGGSARVQQIRAQITRTLLQFPTVREVRIAVAGQIEGVLQP